MTGSKSLFGPIKEFGWRIEYLLSLLELCMLSIMIVALQWVLVLQPGGVWRTLPQDRHFRSAL